MREGDPAQRDPKAFRLEANALQSLNRLSPDGLWLRGLPAALQLSVEPFRDSPTEVPCRQDSQSHNKTLPALRNSPSRDIVTLNLEIYEAAVLVQTAFPFDTIETGLLFRHTFLKLARTMPIAN